MTAQDKLFAFIVATRHVADHGIPGAIVECGVWRGGSMQAVARTLLERGADERDLHLFDTFAGMPPPQDVDRRHDGRAAAELLAERDRSRAHLGDRGSRRRPRRHGGDGLPGRARAPPSRAGRGDDPRRGAGRDRAAAARHGLVRLDAARLEHLYDRVPSGGVVVLDDYGYWEGARRAVDEFLGRRGERLLLVPMASGRIAVKP